MLPPFLEATSEPASTAAPFHSTFTHSQQLGGSKSHCLWWPCEKPSTVLFFTPGNPGCVEFYKPFLEHIHKSTADTLAILGHSLLGHSSIVEPVPLVYSGLREQVEAVVEVIDTLINNFGPSIKLVLVGHSVGTWIVLQALKERSDQITSAFMLFPTIAHIMRTPNGERLSWLFRNPLPWIVSHLSKLLFLVPSRVVSSLFRDWPPDQFKVLWSFINSPSAVLASLTLAHEEMLIIRDLDTSLLEEVKHKLYFFFAEEDSWVGANKDTIMLEMADEPHSVRVVHGSHDIPHAYCINHGEELGDQCLKWLQETCSI